MNPRATLFYDVDTQRDFMLPGGKLYVPGAESILPLLAQLTTFARQHGIQIAGSVDCHTLLDPELLANGGEYPEHCMAGTEGQQKVTVTMPNRPLWIKNRPYTADELQSLLRQGGEVYIEKQRFDVFAGNQNAIHVFDTLLHEKEDLVVYGVVTEVCVDQAITGLRNRPVQLHVPVDAIAALNEERGKEALERWRRWGVHLTTVAEVMNALET
jgi:nicotinamidase/pyrazinamidase